MCNHTNRPRSATIHNAMKTTCTRLALTFGLILSFCLLHAAGPMAATPLPAEINSRARERAVMHQIDRFISFPLVGDQERMYGVVEIDFVVNTEGRVVVVSADSENQPLCDYVVRKLGRIHVGANPSGLWNTSHVRFIFRPEA